MVGVYESAQRIRGKENVLFERLKETQVSLVFVAAQLPLKRVGDSRDEKRFCGYFVNQIGLGAYIKGKSREYIYSYISHIVRAAFLL